MRTNNTFPVIIPAAGIGSRMAASKAKQYLNIKQKTIIEHTIERFLAHKLITDIIVVLHPDDLVFSRLAISNHASVHAVVGGRERVDSVLSGLHHLAAIYPPQQYVLVHDAARPCIDANDISRLVESCSAITADDNICGAILACPVTDTIKQANSANPNLPSSAHIFTIHSTIDRTALWQAQTPQMFMLGPLISAIEKCLATGEAITDEASAMEASGKQVMLVEGQSSNIKITKAADLALASYYLQASQQ